MKLLPILLLLASCGAPPCREVVGAPSCADTTRAIAVADDVLAANKMAKVEGHIVVKWVVAPFLEADDVPAGHQREGHTEPGLTREGLVGEKTVATRLQTSIAQTSLAHEMVHCSFVIGCITGDLCEIDGDHDHSRPEWGTVVPAMRAAQAAAGL